MENYGDDDKDSEGEEKIGDLGKEVESVFIWFCSSQAAFEEM